MRDLCSVLDTLPLARQMHPGQRNSLDALCKRYSVDNSHRELHGALLDAQILLDVYLAMTGGQTALILGEVTEINVSVSHRAGRRLRGRAAAARRARERRRAGCARAGRWPPSTRSAAARRCGGDEAVSGWRLRSVRTAAANRLHRPMPSALAHAFARNFLGHAPDWYKLTIVAFLVLNPLVMFLGGAHGPVIAGWLLLLEFIFTLAMALKCYPLQPGGLLAIEARADRADDAGLGLRRNARRLAGHPAARSSWSRASIS